MSELDPAVRELAAAYGVATEYWDWQGGHVEVGVATVLAVLGALGIDASSPERARDALTGRRDAYWRRMLPTVLVVRTGTEAWFPVHVPHGAPVEVWVELEDGGVRGDVAQRDHWVDPQPLNGGLVGEATFALPGDLPLGWHRLRARSGLIEADVPLVVPPALGDRRVWGFLTQLYQVRSTRSWGIGDLADLADLAAWSGHELGAGFVLVNPLHAACPVPPIEPSPYLPVTRRFAGPLYLRVEAIPEFAYLDDAARGQVHRLAAPLLAASRTAALLDRDLAWTAAFATQGGGHQHGRQAHEHRHGARQRDEVAGQQHDVTGRQVQGAGARGPGRGDEAGGAEQLEQHPGHRPETAVEHVEPLRAATPPCAASWLV